MFIYAFAIWLFIAITFLAYTLYLAKERQLEVDPWILLVAPLWPWMVVFELIFWVITSYKQSKITEDA